jgi:hypothetical protein
MTAAGAVAEWLGRGLQSLAHRFDSGRRLSSPLGVRNVLVNGASEKDGTRHQGQVLAHLPRDVPFTRDA